LAKKSVKSSLFSTIGIAFLICGILALFMGVLSFFAGMSDRDFADKELPGWVETEGIFLDFYLADSGVRSSSDPDDHRHRWWVRFDYTLEYDVYGTKTTVTDTIERSGSRKYQSTIPERELEPPHYTGEETLLAFDPDDPSIYEIGSKESVIAGYRQNAEASAIWDRILLSSGLVLTIAGIFLTRRARKA
jgi:hypothetical protein